MLLGFLASVSSQLLASAGEDEDLGGIPGPKGAYIAILVGAKVQRVEIDSFEVLQSGTIFFVPLENFISLCGCKVEWGSDLVQISTPLGRVELQRGEIVTVRGIPYLQSDVIEQRFETAVVFTPSEFALEFDFPWNRIERRTSSLANSPLAPEVLAPSATLSSLRFDLRTEDRGDLNVTSGYGLFGGRLAGGWWRGRFESSTGRIALRDYGWTRIWGQKLLLVGHQRLNLHPLMGSVELTGAQAAWTNQPLDAFYRSSYSSELLPRRLHTMNTIQGFGPPAGMAELRVNDRMVARQRISLGGQYEFNDVYLPARQANRVEVLLYDRRNPMAPVAIEDHSRTGSEMLLSKGGIVMAGGFGLAGNPTRDLIGETFAPLNRTSGPAGFYQLRYGLTEGWTLDGLIQSRGSSAQILGGVIGQLGRHFGVSGGLSSANGRLGYDLDFYGRGERWKFSARSRTTQSGFYSPRSDVYADHFVEVGYRVSSRLDMGLIARSRVVSDLETSFLLPAITWIPSRRFSLRARPGFDGRYSLDAQFIPRVGARIGLSTSSGHSFIYLTQDIRSGLRFTFGSEFGETGGTRQSAVIDWTIGEERRTSISAGALFTNGKPGFLVGINRALSAGLFVGGSYESASLVGLYDDLPGMSEDFSRWTMSLSGDLAMAGGKFVPANSLAIDRSMGGIGGRLTLDPNAVGFKVDLSGTSILLNGQVSAETDAAGSYFIGQLPAGVYLVTIDPDGLPIELSPVKNRVTVEVAAGAVTRFDFELRAEYGIAGRVRLPNGQPAIGVLLELADSAGKVVTRTSTDQFGLYRMDGLPVGTYVLRAVAESLPEGVQPGSSRQIPITDDFLFDQDLQLK